MKDNSRFLQCSIAFPLLMIPAVIVYGILKIIPLQLYIVFALIALFK